MDDIETMPVLNTPLYFPKNVRASEVRSVLNGCLTRTVLDWMYKTDGYMWFHAGTGGHMAFEMNINQELGITVAARGEMLDVAMTYVLDMLTEDQATGRDTIYATHSPDLDAVEDQLRQCITNWCRDVHPDSADRQIWLEAYDWPPEVEHKAILPGFQTDIDAVFKRDSGFVVVDWKTGAKPKAGPLQLRIYAWALRPEGYGPAEDALFYHAYKGVWQDVAMRNTEREDAYIEALVDATALIKESDILALTAKPGWYCERLCPHYETTCPAFGGDLTQLREHYYSGTWTNEKVQR